MTDQQVRRDSSPPDRSPHNYVGMGYRWESSSRRWGNNSSTRRISINNLEMSERNHRDSNPANHSTTAADPRQCADHSAAVDSFFASIRVPAAFMAATSFNELFGQVSADDSPIQSALTVTCIVSMGLSFVLSVNVMMLSTTALIRSLAEDFDCFAENGYELLFREFHFEFVCVQWSFMVSLFGFLLAVTARVLHQFQLFNVEGDGFQAWHFELGLAVCCIMLSLIIHLLSYVNSTLVGWSNMFDMTVDLVKILVRRGTWSNPAEPISLAIAMLGLVFILLAFILGSQT